MADLSDDARWSIARSTANPDKVGLYDLLTERQIAGTLTLEGQQLLHELRDEPDDVALRKTYAFALLHSRGVTLPPLEDLRNGHQ